MLKCGESGHGFLENASIFSRPQDFCLIFLPVSQLCGVRDVEMIAGIRFERSEVISNAPPTFMGH